MLTFTCALESDFSIFEFCEFGNSGHFAEFEISRIPSFEEFQIACRSRALPRQRDAGEEAGEGEARGRVAVCLECVSARPSMPAMPHERSGASLGELKFCDLEILVSFWNSRF